MINDSVCPCIYDVVLVSNPKEIIQLIERGFLDANFSIIREEGVVYICCKDNIVFCYECHSQSDISKTCCDISDPVNCFDLFYFGFENICLKCKKLILKYFLDILIKIKK